MSRTITFLHIEDFNETFNEENDLVCEYIIQGIDEAITGKKKEAALFSVELENDDYSYQVTLPSSGWVSTLAKIRDALHSRGKFDDAIEAYVVGKKADEFVKK
jgi:hypothetical protein